MFANMLLKIGMCVIWVSRSLKKRRAVDTVVDERLREIPAAQVPRIKRRLQEHRARQATE